MNEPFKVAYCVTTYNGTRLVETIHSIPAGSRLLVMDNSQHGKSLSWCWNYAYDRLIEFEKFDFIVMMNDDIVIRPDTGQLLARALGKLQFEEGVSRPHPDRLILLVGAYNINHVDPKTFGGIKVDWCPPLVGKDRFGVDDLPNFQPRWGTGPDFSCFCFGRPLFQQIGRFDEQFPLYFEDNDTHYRIQGSGYEALSYAPYFHYGSGTTTSTPEIREHVATLFEQSKEYYIRKWGGMPGKEVFKTPFIK